MVGWSPSAARRAVRSGLRAVTHQAGAWLMALALGPIIGCNAPHDNPLDPSLGGSVEGRVLTRRATPLVGVEVEIPQAGRVGHTDTAGRFGLYALPEGIFRLYCSADSYVTDSATLDVKKGRADTLTFFLDGVPFLLDYGFTSHVYYRSLAPEPVCFCRFWAEVGDQDGEADVDSVWVQIASLEYARRLAYDADQKVFVHTIWASSLPNQSLEALVGVEARFWVADEEGCAVQSAPCYLPRIIYDAPVMLFPTGGLDSLSRDTTFVWHEFNNGYPVSYHGEVVRIEGGGPAGVAASFSTSRATDTTYYLALSSLEPGDYYWTLEAIDNLGNSVRTGEERFRVF